MLDKVRTAPETDTTFSHVKPTDTDYRGDGLRDFFLYRDLGVAEATKGKVLAQLVIAHNAPEKGTGWHRHEADFHIVIMLPGRLQDGGCRRGRRHSGAEGLGPEARLSRQNSASSSSIASGSSRAEAVHSFISGSARMAWQ
jgi:hypothetical protein